MDENAIHTAYIIEQLQQRQVTRVEASEAAEQDWVDTVIGKARLTEDFQKSCTPGYYNNEERNTRSNRRTPFTVAVPSVFGITKKWRKRSKLEGLELQA